MDKYNILRDHADIMGTSEWMDVVEYYKKRTARQTATKFGIIYKQAFVSALAREVPKTSHGGARHGAGNLSHDEQKAKEVRNAIDEAKAITLFSTINSDDVNGDNWDEKRVEARNKINKVIARLKAIAATLGTAAIVWYLFF